MKHLIKLGMSSMLLVASLSGTAIAEQSDTLNIRLNSDILSLEPGGKRDNNTDFVIHSIYEGLVGYRTDLSVGGALAASWDVSNEGKTYTFKLREGVTFHNGQAMTAADVKASWDRLTAREDWRCNKDFTNPKGLDVVEVKVIDDATVAFELAKAHGLFLKQLSAVQCQVVVAHGDSWNADGSFNQPIGTGPFALDKWSRNNKVALKRFDSYSLSSEKSDGYAGKREALVANLNYIIVPDSNAAKGALETGEIDVLTGVSADDVEKLTAAGLQVSTAQGLGWATLLVQTEDALLGNQKLRQAIASAIDYEQLAAAGSGGLADVNNSAVTGSSEYYSDALKVWPKFNIAQAKALAKEAGYNGEVIKIQTNQKYDFMYENAVIIQAMLVAAGFNAELEVLDWAAQLDNYLSGEFQLQSFGYSSRFDPGLLYSAFTGDKSTAPHRQWGSKEARDIVLSVNQTDDKMVRQASFEKLHAMMSEEIPIIPMYFFVVVHATGANVTGYSAWAGESPLPWNVGKK
ncbi:MAG: ABC transporter substrate-binding protein [Hyphomicrobiales bacterium]